MELKRLIILIVLVSVICSIGVVSASDYNSTDVNANEEVSVLKSVVDDNIEDLTDETIEDTIASSSNEDISSSDEVYIYVGTNSTYDGQGTENDPYATFDLACNNYNAGEQKDKVTVNVDEGTYYIGSYLKFNTNNLIINGIGNVVVKNLGNNKRISFGCNGNFTMNNVIFNASDWTASNSNWFTPFYGKEVKANVIFNNCTFADYNGASVLPIDGGDDFMHGTNLTFNYCKFVSSTNINFDSVGYFDYASYDPYNNYARFNYCVFSAGFNEIGFNNQWNQYKQEVSFDSCWFGHNDMYTIAFYDMRISTFKTKGLICSPDFIFDRHAVLKVSEKYLGDNKYEIYGKLMWNDSTDDNIDKLGSMVIYLSADNGNIPDYVLLENGAFNVTYTASAPTHEITVRLDQQKIILTNDFNFTADAPIITYGDNQNISVTFQNKTSGTVYVTINNHTDYLYCDDLDSIVVPITQKLSKGTHDVEVTFTNTKMEDPFDTATNLYSEIEIDTYGLSTTTLKVNGKSDYIFEVSSIDNVFVGDEKTLTITLPDDANGTVIVYVNTKEFSAPVSGNTTTLTINGFVARNNVINITYNDNTKYESKNIIRNVNASLKPTTLTATDVTTDYKVAKDLVITLSSNNEILTNKTINVIVGSINENLTTDADGKVSIDISNLDPNTYVATINFAGDELYNGSSTIATVVVKADIKTDITIPEITAGKATTTTIKLPENATGNITLSVDGKIISVVNLTNGSATITIPELSAGKHDVVISYSGDGNYAAFSQNSTVTVKEPAKPTPTPTPAPVKKTKQATKIVAKNKKFKAKTKVKKYTITLKTKAGKAVKKVQVTIKIGKKTYKAKTNSKGKATFKIKKLTKKGKYTATIKFKGNANYKAATKKVKITIKK